MEPRMVLSRLLESSRKAGGRSAEALYERRNDLSLEWLPRGEPRLTSTMRLRVRLVVYQHEGRHAATTIESAQPEGLLERAEAEMADLMARAAAAPPDPLAAPAERYDIEERGLGLSDRRHHQLGLDDRRDVLCENVAGCQGVQADIAVVAASYEEQVLQRAFASTRGVSATEQSTRFSARIEARLGRAGRVHRQQVSARQFAGVASMPFGVDLGERLQRLGQPVQAPAEPLPIILEARPLAHLLRSLARACVAREVAADRSFLAHLPGRRVASPRLHVIDDPTLPGGLCTRAFDDRGVAPIPVVIVREGVAAGLYLDPETSRASDLRPSGHCMGGGIQPSNLVMRPGSRTRNAIGMELGDYLTLDDLHGESLVDPATGMLAAHCDLLLYRNHGLVGAVLGRSLRLPVATLLSRIREVASDQLRVEEVDACPVVLEPFDFAP